MVSPTGASRRRATITPPPTTQTRSVIGARPSTRGRTAARDGRAPPPGGPRASRGTRSRRHRCRRRSRGRRTPPSPRGVLGDVLLEPLLVPEMPDVEEDPDDVADASLVDQLARLRERAHERPV